MDRYPYTEVPIVECCYRCHMFIYQVDQHNHTCFMSRQGKEIIMATRNNAQMTTDDEFGAPDEIIADDIGSDNAMSNNSSGTLSLDQLNEMAFDNSRDEEELAKINPPTGDWKKTDRWLFEDKNIKVNSEDCMPDDVSKGNGRTTFNFMGKPDPRNVAGIEYQPVLFLRISPDVRRKKDKPEEVDMAYKLFLKAKEMYITMHGEKPRTFRQLITMLEEDSYILRTMNGDNGPVVVDIKVERKR